MFHESQVMRQIDFFVEHYGFNDVQTKSETAGRCMWFHKKSTHSFWISKWPEFVIV